MERLAKSMKIVGDHLREDPGTDEKVLAAWDDIRNCVTQMLGRVIELNALVSDYQSKERTE